MVVVLVVVVAAEEGVVTGVVRGRNVGGDKVIGLRVVGGKVQAGKKVDSVVSPGVEASGVGAVVRRTGAEVRAAWLVMVTPEDGAVAKASVSVFGVCVLERAAVLLGMICMCWLTSRVEVSITVVGIFLAVNAGRTSFVTVFSDGCFVFIVVLVVSSAVMLEEVPEGSSVTGIGP